jgi:hypothetical protein
MLEYLELIMVMTAVGVPFYLYISITRYFHEKTEKAARATKLTVQNQGNTITTLEREIEALRGRTHSLETECGEGSDENFTMTSMSRARVA